MKLYAVTDRMWIKNQPGFDQLVLDCEQAIKGGATCIQLREKNISFEDFVSLGQKVLAVTKKYNVPLIINDDVDVALAVNADGVHVGQSDIADGILSIRKKIGDKILGVSAETIEQAIDAEKQGADYLGVGAMIATPTKPDAEVVSFETLKKICNTVEIPVVAIGGINKQTMDSLKNTDVDGIAVVSAIFAQKNIYEATKELFEKCNLLFNKKIKIDGAIFDLDGTLLDSMSMWETIGVRYLKQRQIEAPKNLWEKLKPLSLQQAAEYLRKEYSLPEPLETVMEGINKLIENGYAKTLPLKEGVLEFLQTLYEKHIPMAIATATDKYCVLSALKRLNIEKFFIDVYTCTEVGAGKDKPKVFDVALKNLGTKKENTIIFEDAIHAIVTAKKAKYKVVAVYDAYAKDDEIAIRMAADWYVNKMSDLIGEIK